MINAHNINKILFCGVKKIRIFLVVANVLFLIIGVAFIIGSKVIEYIAKSNWLDSNGKFKDIQSENEMIFIKKMIKSLISIGISIFCFGIFGVIGAVTKSRTLLTVYAVVTVVVFIPVSVFSAILSRWKPFYIDKLMTTFELTFRNSYVGLPSDLSPESLAFDFLMIKFKCCGVRSPLDFGELALKWHKEAYITVGNVNKTPADSGNNKLFYPLTCCKNDPDLYNKFMKLVNHLHKYNNTNGLPELSTFFLGNVSESSSNCPFVYDYKQVRTSGCLPILKSLLNIAISCFLFPLIAVGFLQVMGALLAVKLRNFEIDYTKCSLKADDTDDGKETNE